MTSSWTEATLNRLSPKPKLRAAQTKLVSPGGPLSCRGQFVAETEVKKHKFRFRVLVIVGSHTDILLSRGVAVKMGLIRRVDEVSPQVSDLFGDIGCLADALSRRPLPNQGIPDIELEIASHPDAVMEMKPVSSQRLAKVAVETSQDPQLQTAMKFVRHGWPDYIKAVPPMVQDLYPVPAELAIAGDLLVCDSRIVMLQALRAETLEKLYEGHLGVYKCKERAKTAVWWPGLTKNIEGIVANCSFCQRQKPTQRKEPLMPSPMLERPW